MKKGILFLLFICVALGFSVSSFARNLEEEVALLPVQIESNQWEIKYIQMRYSVLLRDIKTKQARLKKVQGQIRVNAEKARKEKAEQAEKVEKSEKVEKKP